MPPLPRTRFFGGGACCCAAVNEPSPSSVDNSVQSQPRRLGNSDTSCSFEVPSTSSASSASCFETETATLPTIPSIPSVQSLNHLFNVDSAASYLCLATFTRGRSAAAISISPVSPILYTASEDEIAVYDLAALCEIDSFAAPRAAGSVKSVAVSDDGGRIFTAHQDGRVRVWKRSAGSNAHHRLVSTLPTVADRLRRLPLPGSYVTVRRHRKRLWISHADAVSAVVASGRHLYSVSWDKTLKVWRGSGSRSGSDLRCVESVAAHEDAVNAVAVAADGTVYTGSADRRIRVWGIGPGEQRHSLLATLERHQSAVNALALRPDGAVLYSGACDRSILVWERKGATNKSMAVVGALRGHVRAVMCLACVGDLLLSGSSDWTVRIWRRASEGRGYGCLGVMEGHLTGVRSVAGKLFGTSEGTEECRVCSGSLDGEVRVWRIRISNHKESVD